MSDSKKIKVLGYVRVSTDEQAEFGYSLDNQRNDIIKHCEHMKWALVGLYSDEGVSGGTLKDRLGIQNAARRIEEGGIDYLIVWKVSRLSRRLSDVVDIIRLLKDNKTYFLALKDSIDTSSAMGESFLMMASIFAQIERENLIVQVKGGMREKALTGEWNGQAPYGYDMTEGKLEIDTEKAEIVKRIFKEYYSLNHGYSTIVEGLNKDGYKTNKDYAFSVSSVKYILQNPAYAGYVRWGNLEDWGVKNSKGERKRKYNDDVVYVEGIHTAIIDEKLYDEVQKKIKNNPRSHMKRYQGYHLLSGVLRCPDCDYGMSYQHVKSKGKLYEYYTCNQYTNKKTECKANLISKQKIESEFYGVLDKIVSNKEFKESMINSLSDSATQIGEIEFSIKRKETKIKRIEGQQDKMFNELLKGDEKYIEFIRAKIQEHIAEVEEIKITILEAKREIEELRARTLDVADVIQVIEKTVSVLKTLDKEAKQGLIRKIISKVNTQDKHIKSIEFSWGEVLELSDDDRAVSQVTCKDPVDLMYLGL